MNENPGETQNPLNPNNNPLDANPADSTPLEEIVEEVQTVSVEPMPNPVNSASSESVANDPLARPMEQAPVTEPEKPKKKKTGLIVGIIIAAIVLIGGGIAAALIIMNLNRGDAVAKAFEKIISGNAPANVVTDGTLTFTSNEEDSLLSSIQIKLNSEAATGSMLNSSSAIVTAIFSNGRSAQFGFDETYAENGDLYFKLSGLTNAMEDYTAALQDAASQRAEGTTETTCAEDENGEMVCSEQAIEVVDCESADGCASTVSPSDITTSDSTEMLEGLSSILSIIETADGEWLRISTDELTELSDMAQSESDATCLVNMISDAKSNSNSIAGMYSKNPFITSTTEGVTLASKSGDPVYKVTFNNEKFSAFANEFKNSTLVENLFGCMGYDSEDVNMNTVTEMLGNLPTFYVEVDKDYDFTRLYFTADLAESKMSLTSDLIFSYPVNINVAEPSEYTDFSTMFQEMLTSMYALPGTENAVAQ